MFMCASSSANAIFSVKSCLPSESRKTVTGTPSRSGFPYLSRTPLLFPLFSLDDTSTRISPRNPSPSSSAILWSVLKRISTTSGTTYASVTAKLKKNLLVVFLGQSTVKASEICAKVWAESSRGAAESANCLFDLAKARDSETISQTKPQATRIRAANAANESPPLHVHTEDNIKHQKNEAIAYVMQTSVLHKTPLAITPSL